VSPVLCYWPQIAFLSVWLPFNLLFVSLHLFNKHGVRAEILYCSYDENDIMRTVEEIYLYLEQYK